MTTGLAGLSGDEALGMDEGIAGVRAGLCRFLRDLWVVIWGGDESDRGQRSTYDGLRPRKE